MPKLRMRADRMRVLVIDDEPDVLLLCRVNLRYAGHEVFEASNGDRGIELAASAEPDLIVLDIMLPERDGLAILRDLGANPATAQTPVVVLSAKAHVEDQLRGWRAGCSEYVTKPFSPSELADLIVAVAEMTPDERRERRDRAIQALAGAR